MKAELQYKAHGVGKYRTKSLFLVAKNQPAWELPKKLIKIFFPYLPHGCDWETKEVTLVIQT